MIVGSVWRRCHTGRTSARRTAAVASDATHPVRSEDQSMNTRTIAIAALVIAALLLLFLVILPNV